MNESAKRTAHVLLDFYTGFAASDEDSLRVSSFNTALSGFAEAQAFSIEVVEGEGAQVDVTPLLVANGITLQWLIEHLALALDKSEEEILFDLRQFIDDLELE